MESITEAVGPTTEQYPVAGIMLRSADPVRLAAWYNQVLGVHFDEMVVEGCFGILGAIQIGILPGPANTPDRVTRCAVTYTARDFDATLQTLARMGTMYTLETVNAAQRLVFLRDADGNELAITSGS